MEYRGYIIETDGEVYRTYTVVNKLRRKRVGLFRRIMEPYQAKEFIWRSNSVYFKPERFLSLESVKRAIDFKLDGWRLVSDDEAEGT